MITEVSDAKNIWAQAKEQLRDIVLPVWLDTIEVVGGDDCRLRLVSAHALAPQVIKQNYSKKMRHRNFFLSIVCRILSISIFCLISRLFYIDFF